MSAPQVGPNSPDRLARIKQKVEAHADTLLVRHIPDLHFAKTKFSGGYNRNSFRASHTSVTSAGRDPANSLLGAWDAAMNDLNEVLRNAYGLKHGFARVGPKMPIVYAEPALALSRGSDVEAVNKDRNLLTHAYPFTTSGRLFDAVALFEQIVRPTLSEAKSFTLTYGVDIPAVP